MIDTSADALLFLEPTLPPSSAPVIDDLTRKMAGAWRARESARDGYRGVHTCTSPGCGVRSDNRDHWVHPAGFVLTTHSLCVHYLAYHRAEIPEAELEKVARLLAEPVEPDAYELAAPGSGGDRAREPERRVRRAAPESAPPSDLEKLLGELGAAWSTVTGLKAKAADLGVGDEVSERLHGAARFIADASGVVRIRASAARRQSQAPATGTVREFTAADPDCPADLLGKREPGWYYWTGSRWDGQADSRAQAEHYARIGAGSR